MVSLLDEPGPDWAMSSNPVGTLPKNNQVKPVRLKHATPISSGEANNSSEMDNDLGDTSR